LAVATADVAKEVEQAIKLKSVSDVEQDRVLQDTYETTRATDAKAGVFGRQPYLLRERSIEVGSEQAHDEANSSSWLEEECSVHEESEAVERASQRVAEDASLLRRLGVEPSAEVTAPAAQGSLTEGGCMAIGTERSRNAGHSL